MNRTMFGAVIASVAFAGCGLGAGQTPSGVRLSITEDFGAKVLRERTAPKISGQDTVIRLLERNASITTRYGGGFVQSIEGQAGGHRNGRPIDWFFYVNGIESPVGAASVHLSPGDRVWWDRHDWSQTNTIPAVVGSYPEPFLHGSGGRRVPVRVECAQPGSRPCIAVVNKLTMLGVPAGEGSLDLGEGTHTLRVLVGPWASLRHDPVAATLESGPAASGVYAKPSQTGDTLSLLDASGKPSEVLGNGTGLLAATRHASDEPAWLVTGTDSSGVQAAADALDEATLHNRFALAIAKPASAKATYFPLPDGG